MMEDDRPKRGRKPQADKFKAPNRVKSALKQIARGDEPKAKVLAEAALRDIE